MPTRQGSRELPETLAALLLAATSLRVLGSVVAGAIAIGRQPDFPEGRERAADIFSAFGSAGDSTTVLLVLAAAGLIMWGRPRPRADVLRPIVRVLLLAAAVLVVARVAGIFFIGLPQPSQWNAQEAVVTAFGVGDLLLCAGGYALLGRLGTSEDDATSELEPLVFAVDRGNCEVFAFFSYAEAARTIGIYSIAEDEFAFYADDGSVLDAAVVDETTTFTPTDVDAREELMAHLRRFARAKSLQIADPDEPTSYAAPIADWQWLELWPGWMRGIGRLVRRLRG